jgi:hypothetical protein
LEFGAGRRFWNEKMRMAMKGMARGYVIMPVEFSGTLIAVSQDSQKLNSFKGQKPPIGQANNILPSHAHVAVCRRHFLGNVAPRQNFNTNKTTTTINS